MNDSEIKKEIRQLIEKISERSINEISDGDDLFDNNYLDSLSLAELIVAIDERFDTGEIDIEEIIPENFSTITQISNLIKNIIRKEKP